MCYNESMRTITFTTNAGVTHNVQTPYTDEQAVAKLQELTRQKPNSFAEKMIDNYFRYRTISESTRGWLHKLAVEGLDKPQANTVAIGQRSNEKIVELFGRAVDSGLKAPKLRLRGPSIGIQLYFKSSSENKTIYVNDLDRSEWGNFGYKKVYYGKIECGAFVPMRNCPEEVIEMIEKFADDPEGEARAYGKLTNTCCMCGRELSDDKSIKLGFGPVCAKKWGI